MLQYLVCCEWAYITLTDLQIYGSYHSTRNTEINVELPVKSDVNFYANYDEDVCQSLVF